MNDKHGLLSAPINLTLRKMTVPMVFGLFAIIMFNVVDTFFISLLGTEALAAVSFTFPITFAVNSITLGLGVGIAALVARLLGQGDHQDAARVSSHGLILAVFMVMAVGWLGAATINPVFSALGASDNLLPLIHDYMQVWYLTIPLLVVPMAGNAAIRATGDTKTPAKIMMISGVINGVLDPLLIFGLGPFPELGVQGAAIASAVSWAGALIAALSILIRRERLLMALKIGMPAGMTNALNPAAGAILMMMLASQGTESVAAYGAAQRIEAILLIVMMAMTSSLTPLMSQNFGAQYHQRAFQALFSAMRFAILFQFALYLSLWPFIDLIANLFSDDVRVQQEIAHYLMVVPASYGLQGTLMLLVGGLNAMKRSLHSFACNLVRLFVFLVPCAWLGGMVNGTHGLFAGIAVANLLAGIMAYLYAVVLRRQTLAASLSV
jgi:putative MATE family efflux protein